MQRHYLMSQNPMSRRQLAVFRKTGLLLATIFALVFSLAPLSTHRILTTKTGTIHRLASCASAMLKATCGWITATAMRARP